MKKSIVILIVVAVLLIGITTVALAATGFNTCAGIVSSLTGKTEDQVLQARQNGTTYGEQAAQAGKLEEFKVQRLEQYKLRLDEAVKSGRITQAEADKLYNAMKARIDDCDGTCEGSCDGAGNGCQGSGNGICGSGRGLGMGRRSCGNRI